MRRRRLVLAAVQGLGDEDDVDVADVVELAATGLAHADDRQAAGRGAVGQAGDRDGQRSRQRRAGEVGQLAGDVLDGHGADHVAGGELEQAGAVLGAQRGDGLGRREPGPRAAGPPRQRVGRVGADRREQPRLQPEPAGAHGEQVVVGQRVPVRRVPREVVAEGDAHAEDAEQPGAQAVARAQLLQQLRAVGRGLHQPHQRRDGEVGLGRVGSRRQDRGGLVVDGPAVRPQPERLEPGGRRSGVGEAEPHELAGTAAPTAEGAHASASP